MKTLLISDIHGNYEALKEVFGQENWDAIYCMGDIVDYGPSNQECVELIREKADLVVRGNHDNAVAFGVDCGCGYEIKELSQEVRKITVEDISEGSKDYLRELPMTESRVDHFLTHASKDDLYKYLKPDTPEDEFKGFKDIDQNLVFLGHTHIPMDRKVNGKRYINPGSLGQPRDDDTRAA
ncbi:MAG: metallophosphoesterase family protein, partial [Thermoplasmata archaeon]